MVQQGDTSPADRSRRVLLLFGKDQGFPVIGALRQSIWSTLINQSGHLEFYTEYLDRTRINDAGYERELVNFWRQKYDDRKIDLIIVCIASALDLLCQRPSNIAECWQTRRGKE